MTFPYHKPSPIRKGETQVIAMSFAFFPFSNCRRRDFNTVSQRRQAPAAANLLFLRQIRVVRLHSAAEFLRIQFNLQPHLTAADKNGIKQLRRLINC